MSARLARPSRTIGLAREQRTALLAFARRCADSHDDAEDAVQEALTAAFAARQRIRPATTIAYVGVSARHAALRATRISARTTSLDDGAPAGSLHELIADPRTADVDARLDTLAGLRQLKRDEARALAARMLGYSYREIGAGFGWSHTKTDRCLKEGRARLRALLAADLPDPAPPPGEGDRNARSAQPGHTPQALRPGTGRGCEEEAA